MKIVNLTPHALSIHDEAEHFIKFVPPSGTVARLETRTRLVSQNPIPLYKTELGEATVLPPMEKDTIYVVSGLFWSHCDREDLYQPGRLLRDEDGVVIGCVGLSR